MKINDISKNKYYGTDSIEGLTYLEFGGIDLKNSKKEIWDFKTDQTAYDLFMLARYSKEIIGYQDCKKSLIDGNYEKFIEIYFSEVHTKDFLNSIITWEALAFLKKNNLPQRFFELGFTLFGCIEAHEVCSILMPKKNDISQITYSGEEISYLLSELALKLHSNYQVEYSLSQNDLKNDGIFFSKGVTLLYALKEIEDLYHYISKPEISIFDYNFSLIEKQTRILGTGKKINYLSLNEFKNNTSNNNSTLLIRKSDLIYDQVNKRLRCNCLYGNKDFLLKFLKDLDFLIDNLKRNYPENFLSRITSNYQESFSSDYVEISIIEKEFL